MFGEKNKVGNKTQTQHISKIMINNKSDLLSFYILKVYVKHKII